METPKTETDQRAKCLTRVRVKELIAKDYTNVAQHKREKHVGEKGTIVNYHNSHGCCFEVLFMDGEIATYNPEELIEYHDEPNWVERWKELSTGYKGRCLTTIYKSAPLKDGVGILIRAGEQMAAEEEVKKNLSKK